jgi:hypothetical protein
VPIAVCLPFSSPANYDKSWCNTFLSHRRPSTTRAGVTRPHIRAPHVPLFEMTSSPSWVASRNATPARVTLSPLLVPPRVGEPAPWAAHEPRGLTSQPCHALGLGPGSCVKVYRSSAFVVVCPPVLHNLIGRFRF